jgi:hypothetical protein
MSGGPGSGLRSAERAEWLKWGSAAIALAGAAVFVYGLVFLVLNFTAFIELGLTRQLVGTSAAALQTENPTLYKYISHLQVNLAAFIMIYGLALAALAWFGIRRGQPWALWTAVGSYLLGLVVALPIHYVYGLAALGHVGPFYLVTLAMLGGAWLSQAGMPRAKNQAVSPS